jgi:hypothetical protein
MLHQYSGSSLYPFPIAGWYYYFCASALLTTILRKHIDQFAGGCSAHIAGNAHVASAKLLLQSYRDVAYSDSLFVDCYSCLKPRLLYHVGIARLTHVPPHIHKYCRHLTTLQENTDADEGLQIEGCPAQLDSAKTTRSAGGVGLHREIFLGNPP